MFWGLKLEFSLSQSFWMYCGPRVLGLHKYLQDTLCQRVFHKNSQGVLSKWCSPDREAQIMDVLKKIEGHQTRLLQVQKEVQDKRTFKHQSYGDQTAEGVAYGGMAVGSCVSQPSTIIAGHGGSSRLLCLYIW